MTAADPTASAAPTTRASCAPAPSPSRRAPASPAGRRTCGADPVPVTVRFSNGFPSAEERNSTYGDPRGMAVKFCLADGVTHDLVARNWPVFPAGTPEKFRDLLRAQDEAAAPDAGPAGGSAPRRASTNSPRARGSRRTPAT